MAWFGLRFAFGLPAPGGLAAWFRLRSVWGLVALGGLMAWLGLVAAYGCRASLEWVLGSGREQAGLFGGVGGAVVCLVGGWRVRLPGGPWICQPKWWTLLWQCQQAGTRLSMSVEPFLEGEVAPSLLDVLCDCGWKRQSVSRVIVCCTGSGLSLIKEMSDGEGIEEEPRGEVARRVELAGRDREEFVDELPRALLAPALAQNYSPVAQLVREWKATAEMHGDPELARRLAKPLEASGNLVPAPIALWLS